MQRGSDSDEQSGSSENVGVDKQVELTQENFAEEIMKAQLDAGTAHLSMTMAMGGQDITMEGDMSLAEQTADTAMSLVLDGESLGAAGDMEMRLVDQVMYLNLGQMTEDKFAKIDLTDESNPMAEQYGQIMDQSNPASQIEAMGDSIVTFEEDGDGGQIDGVDTVKYLVTLDAVKMYEAQGVDPSTMPGLPETIEYVMYIGEDNLPRRMEVNIPGAEAVNEWSNWGEDISITAPSEDQISEKDLFAPQG